MTGLPVTVLEGSQATWRLVVATAAGAFTAKGAAAAVQAMAVAQLATMGMPDVKYVPERSVSANCSLTMFFEKVVRALERLHANRAA